MSSKETSSDSNSNSKNDNKSQSLSVWEDLIAGGVAGTASAVVGHPFDTYKVRLQTTGTGGSAWLGGSLAAETVALFRGLAGPAISATAVNAVVFSGYGMSSRLWDRHLGANNDTDEPLSQRSLWKTLVCGCMAGALQSFVICPVEHVKCRVQVEGLVLGHGGAAAAADATTRSTTDTFAMTRSIWERGGLTGLYRGFVLTGLREVPGFGAYFTVYQVVKEWCQRSFSWIHHWNDTNGSSLLPAMDVSTSGDLSATSPSSGSASVSGEAWVSSFIAGGAAGAASWGLTYPLDVIKTRIQTAPLDCPVEQRTMTAVARSIFQQHGVSYFYRGCWVAILRSVPVNAIVFPVYEFTLLQLRRSSLLSE